MNASVALFILVAIRLTLHNGNAVAFAPSPTSSSRSHQIATSSSCPARLLGSAGSVAIMSSTREEGQGYYPQSRSDDDGEGWDDSPWTDNNNDGRRRRWIETPGDDDYYYDYDDPPPVRPPSVPMSSGRPPVPSFRDVERQQPFDFDDRTTRSSSSSSPYRRSSSSSSSRYYYSSPELNLTGRRGTWSSTQQDRYRENKFKREGNWPQRQSYGGGRERRYYGEGDSYYYGDLDASSASRQSMAGRSSARRGTGGGREEEEEEEEEEDRGGQQQLYTEDFRQQQFSSSSGKETAGSQASSGKEIGFGRRQQQQQQQRGDFFEGASNNDIDGSRQQERRDDNGREAPPRQGSNIGEQYTEDFRRGSFGADRYGDSVNDFAAEINPRSVRGNYYNKRPPRSPPPPPPPPPMQRFTNENEYGKMREERQQQRGSVVKSFDRMRSGTRVMTDFDEGRRSNNMFDRIARPQSETDETRTLQRRRYDGRQPEQYRTPQQYPPPERPIAGPSGDDSRMGFGYGGINERQPEQYRAPEQYPPERPIAGPSGDDSRMGFGYGGIKRFLDGFLNPFDAPFRRADPITERVDSEMRRELDRERRSATSLLAQARDSLLADPLVRASIGTSVALGKPFSQSSSRTTTNGVTSSRLELVVPASGSEGTGRVRLVAEQDQIVSLDLDVAGRVVSVPLYGQRRREEEAIDASVLEREIY